MAKKTTKTTKKIKYKKKPSGVNDTGRPTKLTKDFIKAAEYVLFEDINTIIFTDSELLMLINERLEPKARVSDSRFEAWKVACKGDGPKDDVMNQFRVLIKKALSEQKKNLFMKLQTSKFGEWTKFAWIIERKFDDWNLRNKTDFKGQVDGTLKVIPPGA